MTTYAVKCEEVTTFYVYVEAESSWDAEAKADHLIAYSQPNWGERDKPACRCHIKHNRVATIRATEVNEEDGAS